MTRGAERDDPGLLEAWRGRDADPQRFEALSRAARSGPNLHPGEIVAARYLLLRHAGDGALAATWAATDLVSDTPVGLKVLHGRFATDPAAREAFEAAAADGDAAPVPVVDSGGAWEGFAWFAVSGDPGSTLHAQLVSGAIGPAVALEVAVRAGRLLAEVHGAGRVHGLVSPDAIRVDPNGEARLHDAGLFTPAAAMGVAWLAPERLDPSAAVGAAADVYGLAMSLLFALNGGELPFWAWRDPERLVATLEPPASVERVLRAAVAWDPAARPKTVGALLDAILGAPSLRRSLAEACLQTGRPRAALDHLEALRATDPANPELLADRARALDALQAPSAELAWQDVLDMHWTREQARVALAALFERSTGRIQVARGRALLALIPEDERPALQHRMGQTLLDVGDAEGALPLLEAALDGGISDPDLPALVARLQTERGDWADLLARAVRRSREEEPAKHLAHAIAIARFAIRDDLLPLQAALLEHAEDPDALRAEVAAIEEREDGDPTGVMERLAATGEETPADLVRRAGWLGRTYPVAAEAVLRAGHGDHPTHLGLTRALARVERAGGDLAAARALWTEVAVATEGLGLPALDGEQEHARAELAWLLGDVVEGAALWHRCLDRDPDDREAWWGLARAAWRAPEDAPWIGATPEGFTPEEALARLLAGLVDPDAALAWLASTPRGAAAVSAVGVGSPLVIMALCVDELVARDAVGPSFFSAVSDEFVEAVLAIEAVRWLWCEPASELLFTIPDCYRWSGLSESFDRRVNRRVVHLDGPRRTAEQVDLESLLVRPRGPLPIESAWTGGTPAMAPERPNRTVLAAVGYEPLELDGTRKTIGGGHDDDLRVAGMQPARVVIERVGEAWYLAARPQVVVDGVPVSERRVVGGQRIAVDKLMLRTHVLPPGAPVPDERDDLQLGPPEAWPEGVHAVLVCRSGADEEVIPIRDDVFALGTDPRSPRVDPDGPFAYKLVRTDSGYTLEDRTESGVSELPAVLPLQHGDTFVIGDRSFTFEQQGVSDLPVAPRVDDRGDVVPILLHRDPTGHETVVPLLDDVFSIGRGGGNDLQLPDDPEISRHHCMLVRGTDGASVLRDSGSANGTWVNGRSVDRHILQVGDIIQVGGARMVFRFGRRDEVEVNLPDMVLEPVDENASRAETAVFRKPIRR